MQVAGSPTTLPTSRIGDPARLRLAALVERGAVIHSTFRSAVNIATPEGLLTIVAAGSGAVPNGIMLRTAPDLGAVGLRTGMTVRGADDSLTVPQASLVVDLRGAHGWSSRLPLIRNDDAADRWLVRSGTVHAIARDRLVPGGLASIELARPRLRRLGASLARADRRAAIRAADGLIGLGPGLTPSGDDALAGVAAALWALGHPAAGFLGGVLEDIEARTTTVSATLLGHAARGEFGERIHHLIEALLGVDDTAIPGAIERAVAWGATSGSDCLVGVLLGLDAAAASAHDRVQVA